MLTVIALIGSLQAASLDSIEVGGAYGTPGATDATAIWWNPAGLAAEKGTQIMLEVAPTFAWVAFDRQDPYGRGGVQQYRLAGAIPFLGVRSDLGVENLGLGLGVAVPFARGAQSVEDGGPGRFAMRSGSNEALYFMLGGAYDIGDRLQIGVRGDLILNQWTAVVDTQTLTSLDHAMSELGQESGYTDDMVEDPNYAATLYYDTLTAVTGSFAAGLRGVLVPDRLALSVTYMYGGRVNNTGSLTVAFGCPPQDDALGRFGAEAYGVCDAELAANGSVAYNIPHRIQAGLEIRPIDALRIEAMGAWVGWKAYRDFDLAVYDVEVLNDLQNEQAADLVNQTRSWARDNRNSFWAGVDVKGDVHPKLTVGGRVMYDHAATPDYALSPNNYDTNSWILGAMTAFRPIDQLEIGLSGSAYLSGIRESTDNAFGVTIEGSPNEDRWFYPQMNGQYSSFVFRGGIVVRGSFGSQ